MNQPFLAVKKQTPVDVFWYSGENPDEADAWLGRELSNYPDPDTYFVRENDGVVLFVNGDHFRSEFEPVVDTGFKNMTVGLFAEVALRNGQTTEEVGRMVKSIETVVQISNGKQPVYIVTMRDDVSAEEVDHLMLMATQHELAMVLIPRGWFSVQGVIEPSDTGFYDFLDELEADPDR